MKALLVALALVIATPAPASALCFSVFQQQKVEQPKVKTVNGVPVAIRTATPKKPDSFCKTVMRSVGLSLAVTTVITGLKLGIVVLTGIPIL